MGLTLNAGEYNSGVIIGNDVSIAVLWFVDLQVGVFPRELLTRVDGLKDTSQGQTKEQKSKLISRSFRQC